MDVRVSQEQGRVPVTVFYVQGDINMESYEQLEQQARQAHATGMRDLIIDISEVPYMSSAGIRVLNSVFNLLRSDSPDESDEAMRKGISAGTFKSPHLKLVSPTKRVHEVLKMAGFDMFLEIHRSVKEAVASF
ncbi:MAG TPA: STAS domain-containing protein [Anaerolineae bacterium]|nr:STAS domain-containing protein [Anaerolineae bacterium]